MSDEPHKERIWPVFVLAAGVVLFGAWLALASPVREVSPTDAPRPFIEPLPAIESAPVTEPIRLRSAGAARAFDVDLRQEQQSGEDIVQTRLALRLVESAAEKSDDVFVRERAFEAIDVTMYSNGEAIGPGVAHEVERLLETARVRVRDRPTGEIVDTTVISAEAAQLRQILSVIQETLNIVRPRIPREAVRAGETWEWAIGVRGQSSEDVEVRAAGKMHVTARVVGEEAGRIVIELQLEGQVDLTVSIAEEASSQTTTQSGSGRGVAIWDLDTGLVQSDVRWEQRGGETSSVVRAHVARVTATE